MKVISRIDEKTGDTLVWCGSDNFNPIETQGVLQASGLSLKTIRDDKWAVVGPNFETASEENGNGQEAQR